jgi:hypothetical protein
MSFSQPMSEAKADIKAVELHNEANMKGSPILKGQSSGGPEGKGDLTPKTYTLGPHTTEMKREL